MTGQRPISESELHAFVDGELGAEEYAELEGLLASAPAEQATVAELRELNELLRARYAGYLGAAVPAAMVLHLGRFRRDAPGPVRRLLRPAAGIALLVASAAAGYLARGFMGQPHEHEAAFVATAMGAHTVYVPEVRHPVEVKADEAHLVRWLTKRVGAEVRAPALVNAGWKLMGGRLLPDQEGLPAAQFMYEDATGRRLTLYMRKETGLDNTAFRFAERDGFGAFYWIDRPLAYALTGRLSREELMTLADLIYGQLETPAAGKTPPQPGQPQ